MAAFVLRISPSGIDRFPEALENNVLIIGWSGAPGLLNGNLNWEQFRQIIYDAFHAGDDNMRAAGRAAGHMWRFIREMNEGDLVVVPYGPEFFVASVIEDDAFYDDDRIDDDTAFRRRVVWLNEGRGIPRSTARAALVSRMKTYGTSAYASDLVEEIQDCLDIAAAGEQPAFDRDLQRCLVETTLEEMRSGHIDNYGFERLIKSVYTGLGAVHTRIVPRSQDEGIDIFATFRVAGTIRVVVGIQAKHYGPDRPVGAEAVRQLIGGIETDGENVTHGIVVTSGVFNDEATETADDYAENGIPIELVDGEQLAKLIVEHGLQSVRNFNESDEF